MPDPPHASPRLMGDPPPAASPLRSGARILWIACTVGAVAGSLHALIASVLRLGADRLTFYSRDVRPVG